MEAKPVGLLWMQDEAGPDAKILCVPPKEPRWRGVEDLRDLPEELLEEIKHFFDVYKALEPGKAAEHGRVREPQGRLAGDRAQPGPPPRVH